MKNILFFGALSKFFLFLFLSSLLPAEITKMEDGHCYESKGKMRYIAPCPRVEKKISDPEQMKRSETTGEASGEGGKCLLKIEGYGAEFVKTKVTRSVSCSDAQEYFDTMSLGYDKSLKNNKIKIGEIIVKKRLSKCVIALYYGDFMTIGLMAGDRLMCDDFMIYHSMLGSRSRRRY